MPGSRMCRDAYVWCVVVIKGKGRVERLDAYSSLLLPLTRVFLVAWNISLVAQMVKNLPARWENLVQSLGWEDSLEKGKATHSSILAWKIPWTEEPGRLQSMGL